MSNPEIAYLKPELKLRDAREVLEEIDNMDLIECSDRELKRIEVLVENVLRKIR